MQNRQVVIISDPNDLHIPPVSRYLDAEPVIIDPIRVTSGEHLSYRFDGCRMSIDYRGLPLDSVASIWYRKPNFLTLEDIPVPEQYRLYALSAIERHVYAFNSEFPDALWVSDSLAISRANKKPHQLEVAARIGFAVPTTLYTSDPNAAKEFLDLHDRCVVKTAAVDMPPGLSFYTSLIDKSEPPEFSGLPWAPAIFQQYIRGVHELRVTVVGMEVFAAYVYDKDDDGNSDSKILDHRVAHAKRTFAAEAVKLSDDLAEKCVQYLRYYGLNFGAFDFIVDSDGIFWFLECNPNGQWLYIEEDTGQQIGKALASLLAS